MTRERWIWIDPLRYYAQYELSGFADGVEITKGLTGRFAPPSSIKRTKLPTMPGSIVGNVTHETRVMTMSLVVQGSSPEDLRARIAELAAATNPMKGPGTLKHIASDGTVRHLTCFLHGFEQIEEGNLSPSAQSFDLLVEADDPYWYDEASITGSWGGFATEPFFHSGAFFPLTFSPSAIQDWIYLDNTGDLEAWPTWLIGGPFTKITLITQPPGSLVLEKIVAAHRYVIIDTRPGIKTVKSEGNVNLFPDLTSRDFQPIPAGGTSAYLAVEGSTASSYVMVSYKRRWLSAV